ncbi:MAG TPA: hypothetical protein VNW23_07525 [Opitutaceae bacterium]|jgi:hypothetical protein|nr:hypothetical protein [Opitutaceae bacterium]
MAKPRKVGEPAGTYITKKPAIKASLAPKAGEQHVRYIDAKTARKLTEQIFDKHHELFRKLAQ